MQLTLEVPDNLAQELVKINNMQDFVLQAIQHYLFEDKRDKAKRALAQLMAQVPANVSLSDDLIHSRRLEAKQESI